jgi:hypothetical protein
MKKASFFAALLVSAFLSVSTAGTTIQNMCQADLTPFGGVDVFPWSAARPFPWTSIEGRWITEDESMGHLHFQFKVLRTTQSIKQLAVQIFDIRNCDRPVMNGIGIIATDEKNVMRVVFMNDILLKIALFRTSDLKLDDRTSVCTEKLLGATFYKIQEDDGIIDSGPEQKTTDLKNVVLKKISSKTDFKCK